MNRSLWLVMGLCLAAHADDGTRPVKMAPPTRIPDPVTGTAAPGVPVTAADVPRSVRRAVVAEAAKRFNVAESAVVLVRAEQVTWSDGSLGCPEPGRAYIQALVPGFRITATTQSGQTQYHTDAHAHVVHCLRHFQPGPKNLPSKPQGSDAEPRTQPRIQPPDR
jgi:hypothetical protein